MRKTITSLTAALLLVSTSLATSASAGGSHKNQHGRDFGYNDHYNDRNDHGRNDHDYGRNDHDPYDFDQRHHKQKYELVFFKDDQPDLKCKRVVLFIPKWDDHWLASYHPGDYGDDHGDKHGHKFKKIVGYLCKVPVSRY